MHDHVVVEQNDDIVFRRLNSEIIAVGEIFVLLVTDYAHLWEAMVKVFLSTVRAAVIHYYNFVFPAVKADRFEQGRQRLGQQFLPLPGDNDDAALSRVLSRDQRRLARADLAQYTPK